MTTFDKIKHYLKSLTRDEKKEVRRRLKEEGGGGGDIKAIISKNVDLGIRYINDNVISSTGPNENKSFLTSLFVVPKPLNNEIKILKNENWNNLESIAIQNNGSVELFSISSLSCVTPDENPQSTYTGDSITPIQFDSSLSNIEGVFVCYKFQNDNDFDSFYEAADPEGTEEIFRYIEIEIV